MYVCMHIYIFVFYIEKCMYVCFYEPTKVQCTFMYVCMNVCMFVRYVGAFYKWVVDNNKYYYEEIFSNSPVYIIQFLATHSQRVYLICNSSSTKQFEILRHEFKGSAARCWMTIANCKLLFTVN